MFDASEKHPFSVMAGAAPGELECPERVAAMD